MGAPLARPAAPVARICRGSGGGEPGRGTMAYTDVPFSRCSLLPRIFAVKVRGAFRDRIGGGCCSWCL